jgi:23S rRNA (pseudouridine1915-N3)-methyltransferase
VKCIELQSPKAVVGAQDSQLKEKEIIERRVFEKHDYVIVCRERGDEFSSQSLYSHIKKLDREIAIVISGAYGPHKSIVDNSSMCLSLSKLTFTHEMALYILLEQCYRLECFDTNKEYSK